MDVERNLCEPALELLLLFLGQFLLLIGVGGEDAEELGIGGLNDSVDLGGLDVELALVVLGADEAQLVVVLLSVHLSDEVPVSHSLGAQISNGELK